MKGKERGEKVRSVAQSPEATPGAAQLAHGPPASQRPTLPAGVDSAGLGAGAEPAAQEGNLLNHPGRAAPTPRSPPPPAHQETLEDTHSPGWTGQSCGPPLTPLVASSRGPPWTLGVTGSPLGPQISSEREASDNSALKGHDAD